MIYFIGKYLLGPFILLFWRPRVFGGKHLKVKGPAIFIANHLSMADPLLIALLSPRVVHFMAKKEIFQNLIGRWFFRSLFAFPINRENGGSGFPAQCYGGAAAGEGVWDLSGGQALDYL